MLRAALSAAVRPPLPTRSCDLAGIPQKPARWSAKGEPPPLSCPCRSNVALLRLLARIAPVAPQGIVAASATGGAPIPCPSKEGNYGGSGQILCSQPPPCRKSLLLFLASTCRQSAPHPQPPPLKGEGAQGLTQNFYITSGAVIFRRERTFSSTVAVARHRAARAAQTAWSSHFTRQFW